MSHHNQKFKIRLENSVLRVIATWVFFSSLLFSSLEYTTIILLQGYVRTTLFSNDACKTPSGLIGIWIRNNIGKSLLDM